MSKEKKPVRNYEFLSGLHLYNTIKYFNGQVIAIFNYV